MEHDSERTSPASRRRPREAEIEEEQGPEAGDGYGGYHIPSDISGGSEHDRQSRRAQGLPVPAVPAGEAEDDDTGEGSSHA